MLQKDKKINDKSTNAAGLCFPVLQEFYKISYGVLFKFRNWFVEKVEGIIHVKPPLLSSPQDLRKQTAEAAQKRPIV